MLTEENVGVIVLVGIEIAAVRAVRFVFLINIPPGVGENIVLFIRGSRIFVFVVSVFFVQNYAPDRNKIERRTNRALALKDARSDVYRQLSPQGRAEIP